MYAHQAQNYDAERQAAEVRIRAERKAGQILQEMKTRGERDSGAGGDRKSLSGTSTVIQRPKTLPELGVSRNESSQWQRLADVPEQDFEDALRTGGPVPTTEGIINAHALRKTDQPRINPDALWLTKSNQHFRTHGAPSDPFALRRHASAIAYCWDHLGHHTQAASRGRSRTQGRGPCLSLLPGRDAVV
jgi:hypothetical protein